MGAPSYGGTVALFMGPSHSVRTLSSMVSWLLDAKLFAYKSLP